MESLLATLPVLHIIVICDNTVNTAILSVTQILLASIDLIHNFVLVQVIKDQERYRDGYCGFK